MIRHLEIPEYRYLHSPPSKDPHLTKPLSAQVGVSGLSVTKPLSGQLGFTSL